MNLYADFCPGSLHVSLFIVGEIGRNDYLTAYLQGKTSRDVQNMVPEVTEIIENALRVSFLVPWVVYIGDGDVTHTLIF